MHEPAHSAEGALELEATACSLCGQGDFQSVYSGLGDLRHGLPGSFDVVRCLACGLVRTMPRPTRDTIAEFYPESYSDYANRPQLRTQLSLVRRAFSLPHRLRFGDLEESPPRAGARALEVGSGAGADLARLAAAGWETWGIEPSADAAAAAGLLPGVSRQRIISTTVEEAQLETGSFDLIRMSHALEHAHDPRLAIAQAAAWLRPNGLLRILVPNFGSLERRLFRRRWAGLDVPRHLYHFTPRTLKRLLEECGLGLRRVAPQFQGITLAASVELALDGVRGRPPSPVRRSPAYVAVLPLGWLAAGFGDGACLDVLAAKGSEENS